MSPPTDNIPSPRKRADFPQVFRHERTLANRLRETSRYVGGRNACWCGSRTYARLDSIEWRNVWRTVRRLRARIVKAVTEGRWNKVKALVYLLTRCLVAGLRPFVRVVSNSGAQPPGVDRILWNTPEAKSAAFMPSASDRLPTATAPQGVHSQKQWKVPRPRNSHDDRSGHAGIILAGSRSHCGVPKPIGHSYGFRLERRCADALKQSHLLLGNRHGPQWILEGDIKACFDRVTPDWLLTHIPMDQQLLRQWLKAGFLEKHAGFATTEGTPQGGTRSPGLANWTLDGLQRLLGGTLRRCRNDHGSLKSTWSVMRTTS